METCCADYHKTTLDDGTVVESHTFRCASIARSEEREKRIKAKGHDCDEHRVHGTYLRDNGSENDSYHCGICGDLLQVG